MMQFLTLAQVADYLESVTIERTQDVGHAFIHTGHDRAGGRFVVVNDANGDSVLIEGMA